MRKFLKLSLNASLFVIVILCIACQSEEPLEEDIDAERTIIASSSVIEMMKNITAKDGSYDNIVDGASCIGIQFPYSVLVNGTQLTISTMENLNEIEKILDETDGVQVNTAIDDLRQSVTVIFPVTVTLSDQTEIMVENEAVLEELTLQCVEGGDDTDIECVDFIYPDNTFYI